MAKIPETRLEAFQLLDKHLKKKERAELAACPVEDLTDYHFGLGLWIRNTWIYAGGGQKLAALFSDDPSPLKEEESGSFILIGVPDDISMDIIRAYRQYLIDKL